MSKEINNTLLFDLDCILAEMKDNLKITDLVASEVHDNCNNTDNYSYTYNKDNNRL